MFSLVLEIWVKLSLARVDPVVDPEIHGIVFPISPDLLDSEGPEMVTVEVGQQSTECLHNKEGNKFQLLENNHYGFEIK